jgi:hypothetical protein
LFLVREILFSQTKAAEARLAKSRLQSGGVLNGRTDQDVNVAGEAGAPVESLSLAFHDNVINVVRV